MSDKSKSIRYGDYISQVSVKYRSISYNDLTPKPEYDESGAEIPYSPPPVKLTQFDIYQIFYPYVNVRFLEQVYAVAPLALYLALFQVLILRVDISDPWIILGGFVAVVVGLMLFMEGLKVGLMPFGEIIGDKLPKKSALPVVLFIAFLMGVGVTFAEPAIGALKIAGKSVKVESSPYLYVLLNAWQGKLVLSVGIGVGFAAALGAMRFIYGWSLKPYIFITLIPTIGLTAYAMSDPNLERVLGLAWDCGAVTTGPVTVPLVLSLGIGIASAAGKGDTPLSGFGIVTLASLFPIICVLTLAVALSLTIDADQVATSEYAVAANAGSSLDWHQITPTKEIIDSVRAIAPMVIFLFFVLTVVLKERLKSPIFIAYGISLAIIGMIVFNVGLTYGLSKLGSQSGSIIPAAFTTVSGIDSSPLFHYFFGLVVALGFAAVLGFGATIAEPALAAMGLTVENLTNGAYRKSFLIYAVSLGVAIGVTMGVIRITFGFSLGYLLIPGYALAVILTWLSTEEFVNIAWDSAGVTTGPVTVPLVLAMGIGFGGAVNAEDGFGILAMASIGPILTVLSTGLWIQWKIRKSH